MKRLAIALLTLTVLVPTATVATDVATAPAAEAWHYDDFRNCGGHYNNFAHRDTWYAWYWIKSYTYGTDHWHYTERYVFLERWDGSWYWKRIENQWYRC